MHWQKFTLLHKKIDCLVVLNRYSADSLVVAYFQVFVYLKSLDPNFQVEFP